jgi:TANFOR domain-containing protein
MRSLHIRFLIASIAFALLGTISHAQNYPVQANVQLLPPYTPYLGDYVIAGSEKISIQLLLKDISVNNYQVKLRLKIEGVGITIQTENHFSGSPITLQGGSPILLSAFELAPYFNTRNLQFIGLSKSDLQRTGKLPEGLYKFTIEVFDFHRNKQVANPASAMAWIVLNDPPLINLPVNNFKVTNLMPQFIAFQWTPRHMGSPNSAFTTEYIFKLVEIWPIERNANDAILSQRPIYETTTNQTQLIYGPTEPLLIPGRNYAWQITARDTEKRDLFKNQGRSEVFMFRFGDACNAPKNIKIASQGASFLRASWSADPVHERYNIRFREQGQHEWYGQSTISTQATLSSLNPGTTYEYKIQADCGQISSDYSAVFTEKTLLENKNQFVCGAPSVPQKINSGEPLLQMLGMNDVIDYHNYKITVKEITASANGAYSGNAIAVIPYLNSAQVKMTFKNVRVTQSYKVISGEMETVWNPDSEWTYTDEPATEKDIDNSNEKPGQGADTISTTVPEVVTIAYEGVIDSVYVGDDGKIVVVDEQGHKTDYDIGKDKKTDDTEETVIKDEKGGSWVVKKDPATGLTSVSNNTGSIASGNTSIESDPIKDRIIVLILEQFEEEIGAWLRINGKGGEEDNDVFAAEELPEAFPKETPFMKHLRDNVIPFFKENSQRIRADIERTASNKSVLSRSASLFQREGQVDWVKIEQSDREILRDVTAHSMMNLRSEDIDKSQLSNLEPDCGFTHAGKAKPLESKFLITYPDGCSASWNYYISEGVVADYIAKGYGKYLCAKERFDLIKCLSTGTVLESEELAIITLLDETPAAHAPSLLSLIDTDDTGLLKNINSGFQFSNYVAVFKAIQVLYLSGTTQGGINAEIEKINNTFLSDKTREEKAQQNFFTWFEGGLLKAFFDEEFVFNRFDNVSIADNGIVSFNYATDPKQHEETTTLINIKPFALVGIRVKGNPNEVLEAGDGDVVYVPGIILPLLISKKGTADLFDALNATAVVTGAGSILTGSSSFVIASGGIDVLLGGSALVVDNYKDDILKMSHGKEFLDAYVLVNDAFLIYFSSSAVLQLTQALPKLSNAFSNFKNADDFIKLKATNPSKAAQIENEVEGVITKGDEILNASVKNTDEFLARLSKITPPKSEIYKGDFYRTVDNGLDPLQTHPIPRGKSHRYSKPGEDALYFSSSQEGNFEELTHWGKQVKGNTTTYLYKDVEGGRLLDLTNQLVRDELGISLDQITNDSYEFTQAIGSWSRGKYDGIIAPSARGTVDNKYFVNMVIFESGTANTLIKGKAIIKIIN